MSRMTKRRKLLFGAATLAFCGTLAFGMTIEAPLILYPITPSLPPGLYVRTFKPPKVGMIAAFRVPEAAKRYKASVGETVHDDFLFMKPVVAGPGDYVCHRCFGGIYVNDARIAEDTIHDQTEEQLPQWTACRRLADEEISTLSTYTRTSFDSRHFGPIPASSVVGVYSLVSKDRS